MNTRAPRPTKPAAARATIVDVLADTLLGVLLNRSRVPAARPAPSQAPDPSPETASIVHVTGA